MSTHVFRLLPTRGLFYFCHFTRGPHLQTWLRHPRHLWSLTPGGPVRVVTSEEAGSGRRNIRKDLDRCGEIAPGWGGKVGPALGCCVGTSGPEEIIVNVRAPRLSTLDPPRLPLSSPNLAPVQDT